MRKSSLLFVALLALAIAYPTASISRWFSSSFYDLKVTLRRFSHCVGQLPPLRTPTLNETEFLIHQMRLFLDQVHYDNEHLSNITALMDNICRQESNYSISMNIDVNKYNNTEAGKQNRCQAIDDAMDAMFRVFKRVAMNKSEPLDFSSIQFYPKRNASYGLIDLINTSWIKSDFLLERTCYITDSIKKYVTTRSSFLTAQDRSQVQQRGYMVSLVDFIDRLLDPILGLQRRFYWESNNRFERMYTGIASQLVSVRESFGQRYRSLRDRNSTLSNPANATLSKSSLNQTISTPVNIKATTTTTTTTTPMTTTTTTTARPVVV